MNEIFNPPTIAPPRGPYSHCCKVPAGANLLFVAGQGGVQPDGTVPKDAAEQCEWALRNVRSAVEAGGMDVKDIVNLTVLLLDRDYLPHWRSAIQTVLGDFRPPAIVTVVTAVGNPAWMVEIGAVAARQG